MQNYDTAAETFVNIMAIFVFNLFHIFDKLNSFRKCVHDYYHVSLEDDSATPGHSQKVFVIKFHPDDKNVFISASWDRSLKVGFLLFLQVNDKVEIV